MTFFRRRDYKYSVCCERWEGPSLWLLCAERTDPGSHVPAINSKREYKYFYNRNVK